MARGGLSSSASTYWERDGADPAGYAKKNEYPWKILLEGDGVGKVHEVECIPALFLIHKGKIIYTSASKAASSFDIFW